VRFSHALNTAATEHATFIEVSPHPLLTHAITDTLASVRPRDQLQVEPTVTRDGHETLTFHTQLATIEPPLDGMARRASDGGHLADLPPTPWQHARYWVENRSASPQFTGTHPLLGAHVEMPSGRGHVWQADIGTEVNPWLADHKVHGQPVMPAAGFAEIALAAGSEALAMPAAEILVSRLEVEQMLLLQGQTRITTQLAPREDGGFCVEVFSRSAGDNWCRHAVARVEVARRQSPAQRPNPATESGIELSTGDFYAAMRRTGAHHGQAFAALTRIVRMPAEAIESEIVLPEEATAHRGYRIHPVMFDAALQSLAAAMPAELLSQTTEVTYLPVSIESVRVFADMGRHARCHAEMVGVEDDAAGKLGRITLFDDAGNPTAEITGVYLRRVQRRTVPLPLEQKLFDTTWEEHPLTAGTGPVSAPTAGSWLVLADGDTKAVAEGFTEVFGSSMRRLITADLADESAVLEAFAKTAADPDFPPQGVVVFVGQQCSFDGTDSDGASLQAQEAVWRTLAAARAIVGGWHGKSPRLWLVTRGGLTVGSDEWGDPAAGALKGLIRVLAYEHPDLRATLVDLDSAAEPESGQSSFIALTTELEAAGPDDVIAWRGGHRHVERLSRAVRDVGNSEPIVRPDGSYVVTGGLGGLGLVVVGWLVDNGAGRVVVNGRSGLSAENRESLAKLEDRAEVVFVRGDIASPRVAERVVTVAEETGLPLRGVIHSAAVIDDALVTALDRDSLERVWNPKAVGALRLHEATATRELDWWVAFSSVASLLGSPGQAAYACANAYVDALVEWRRAAGLPATSINWGQWSDVGVARSLVLGVLDPISPEEGIEALESLLGGGIHRAGVARLRLDRASAAFPEIRELGYFSRLVEELESDDDDDDWPGPAAIRQMDAAEATQIVAARLRGRILAIMGYPAHWAIEASQPLIELGMDSLMAVRIRNTARGDFGVEPPVALLLQGASLQDLTADLIRQLGLSENVQGDNRGGGLRDRTHQRAAARQFAAARRKTGQRV
jgi:phthiocerol/phenolphthiocerol synthesis type-I polyketide synthase D